MANKKTLSVWFQNLFHKIKQFFYVKGKLSWKRIVLVGLGGVLVLTLLITGGLFAWFSRDLPSPDRINSRDIAQSTMIYDRKGNLLYEVHGDKRRILIGFDKMPNYIKWATVAIEDKDFYHHLGVDFRGIFRAAYRNIFGGSISQGGSTLTQQFVKNALLTPERTFTRKIKEVILSLEIEQKYTKDEILRMYLNEIPYGANAYGIQAAAETYFNKDAKKLTLAECALLAAITKAPTYYSPYGSHTDEMKQRQHTVLDYMADQGYITQKQANKAKKQKIKFAKYHEQIKAPHFVMYVRELLVEKYGEKMVEEGGLKVTTTLDPKKQKIAEEAINHGVMRNRRYNASNAALVSIDPRTGQILAMVGSYDYFDVEHDGNVNVALRNRQPGSSFKPYAYATAFKKGFPPTTVLFDLTTNFGGGYIPHNYDNRTRGPVQMQNALAMSLNIPAVKTLYLAGVDKTIDTAHAMGINTLNDPDRYGLALVLGGGEVKLLEHTAAFGVFATNGIRHEKTPFLKIEDNQGKTLEEYKNEGGTQVLDQNIAKTMNKILSTDSLRAPVFGSNSALTLGGRPVAAKTGTTNEFRDAWTVGYTPSLVTGVWTGNNNNTKMNTGADGIFVAAPIWHEYMKNALKGKPWEKFDAPKPIKGNKPILNGQINKGVEKVKVCKISGKLATEYCPHQYVQEKSFGLNHCILYYVDKDNPLGPKPTNPASDPQFKNWEAAVSSWAKGKNLGGTAPTEKCDIHLPANQPSVSISSPLPGQSFYNGEIVGVTATASAPKGVKKVDFYFDQTLIGSDSSAPYSYSIAIPSYASAGGHSIKAKAYDIYYNEDTASVSITVNVDSTDPTCTLTAPPNGANLLPGVFPYAVTASASDGESGVSYVEFFVDGASIGKDYSGSGGTYSVFWPYPGIGVYTVHARAYDRAGNAKNSSTATVNVF